MKALAEIALRNGADADDSRRGDDTASLPLDVREQMLEEALADHGMDDQPRTVPYATGTRIPANIHEREYRLGRSLPELSAASGGRDSVEKPRGVRSAPAFSSSSVRSLLTLKPYGNHLVDGVVGSWLIFARICILTIALCEGIAWAYLGRVMASGPWASVAAVLCGVMVFLLVGSLSAALIMHDSTAGSAPPEKADAGRKVRRGLQILARVVDSNHVAMLVRVLLVLFTFIVTAPALTMLVFSRDIDAAIAKQRAEADAVARAALVKRYDVALSDVRTQLQKAHATLQSEAGGTGLSHRPGEGPTVRTLREQIRVLESAHDSLEARKVSDLRAFDTASPAERAARFGVPSPREGPEARARVLAELEQSPAFRDASRVIQALLVFLFLSLLTLKVFQPRGVQRYYSEFYQTVYADYLAGAYDNRLRLSLRPDQNQMTPAQFIRWYDQEQRPLEERERVQIAVATAVETLQLQRSALESLTAEFAPTLATMREDLDAAVRRGAELERRLKTGEARLVLLQSRLNERQEHPSASEETLESSRQLQTDRIAEVELQAEIRILADQLAANARERDAIRAAMENVGSQVAVVDERMRVMRLQMLDEIAPVA